MAQAETLTDALISAYKNSPLLEQNRALLRAADEDVAVAVSRLRPVVSFLSETVYVTPTFGDNLSSVMSLTASLDVLTFGANRLGVDAAKEAVMAAREGLIQVEQQVLLNAVAAYMNVVRAREVVALRENNVRLISRELRGAEERFEVSALTRTDLALAQSRLAAARSQLAAAEGDLDVAREIYILRVGREPGDLVTPTADPALPESEQAAKAGAAQRHPLVRQAQRETRVADLNVQRAIASMKPRVSVYGEVQQDEDERTNEEYGLRINVPIYQGGRLSALHRSAVAQRDASRANLIQTGLEVQQAAGTAWAEMNVARATLVAATQQIRAAEVAFEGAREEARVGARTTLEVLDRERELNDARTARVNAFADEIIAAYSLLSAMGLMTVDHLGLGVPTYDPSAYYNAVKNAPATSDRGRALDRVFKSIGRTYE